MIRAASVAVPSRAYRAVVGAVATVVGLVVLLAISPTTRALLSATAGTQIGAIVAGNMQVTIDDGCTWTATLPDNSVVGGQCATLNANPWPAGVPVFLNWTGSVTMQGDNLRASLTAEPGVTGDVSAWGGWAYNIYLGGSSVASGTAGSVASPAVTSVSTSTTFRVEMALAGDFAANYVIADPTSGTSADTLTVGAPTITIRQVRP